MNQPDDKLHEFLGHVEDKKKPNAQANPKSRQRGDQYQLKKTLLGKYVVKFACPGCKGMLNVPLEQAGTNEHCPDCQAAFVVPGKDKLAQWNEQQEQKAREAASQAAERQREQQAARKIQEQENAAREAEAQRQRGEWEAEESRLAAMRAEQEQQKSIAEKEERARQPSSKRYPVLHFYKESLKIIGVFTCLGGAAALALGAVAAFGSGMSKAIPLFGSALGLLTLGGSWLVISELVTVLVDIERNTRDRR